MISNKTPAGTYRGPGRFEGCFFMERLLDMAAPTSGSTGSTIRRRNLIALAEMPYRARRRCSRTTASATTSCDSGDYTSTFDRCVARGGLERKRTSAAS